MKRFIEPLKNKYIITSICLILWVLFFDKNDLSTILKLHKEVDVLEEERDYYKQETAHINEDLRELINDSQALEKFARENYLMKRDNEDIFVIVRK
jgi:cell division protein FtsB